MELVNLLKKVYQVYIQFLGQIDSSQENHLTKPYLFFSSLIADNVDIGIPSNVSGKIMRIVDCFAYSRSKNAQNCFEDLLNILQEMLDLSQ